jgi:hypothetical protein
MSSRLMSIMHQVSVLTTLLAKINERLDYHKLMVQVLSTTSNQIVHRVIGTHPIEMRLPRNQRNITTRHCSARKGEFYILTMGVISAANRCGGRATSGRVTNDGDSCDHS